MKSILTTQQQTKLNHFRNSVNDTIKFAKNNNIYDYVKKGAKIIEDTQLITKNEKGLHIDKKLTKRFLLSLEHICGSFSLHMDLDISNSICDLYPRPRSYVDFKYFLHTEDGFEYHHLHTYLYNVYLNVYFTLEKILEANEWGIILSELNNLIKQKQNSILCNSDIFKLTHYIQKDINSIRKELEKQTLDINLIQTILESISVKYEELLLEAKIYDKLVTQLQLI